MRLRAWQVGLAALALGAFAAAQSSSATQFFQRAFLDLTRGGTIGGDLTVSGDAGVTGHASIAGNLNVTGFVRGGDAGFHNVTASGDVSFAGLISTSNDLVADTIATDGSGNGTATVPNNSLCYCSPTSAPVNACNRSGTTLTVQAGVASDPVQFFCIVKL